MSLTFLAHVRLGWDEVEQHGQTRPQGLRALRARGDDVRVAAHPLAASLDATQQPLLRQHLQDARQSSLLHLRSKRQRTHVKFREHTLSGGGGGWFELAWGHTTADVCDLSHVLLEFAGVRTFLLKTLLLLATHVQFF